MLVKSRYIMIACLVFMGFAVAWRIITLGLSAHLEQKLSTEPTEVNTVLTWNPNSSNALFQAGMQNSTDQRLDLLKKAIVANPTNSLALMALLKNNQKNISSEEADQLLELVIVLSPANKDFRLQAADYWVRREQWLKAMQHWNVALEISTGLQLQIFPILLAIAEKNPHPDLWQPVLTTSASWWSAFFRYATVNTTNTETIKQLFMLRRRFSQEVTLEDRQIYFTYLKKTALWPEAYIEWMNSLSPHQRKEQVLLFNGSFEEQPTRVGFDWHPYKTTGVILETARTYGMTGQRAMRIVLQNDTIRFNHLHQPLLLASGNYQLQGRVRVDSLHGGLGLNWKVRCEKNYKLLGKSQRFIGMAQWHVFNFKFDVPRGCLAQSLYLVAEGSEMAEFGLKGEIWFDDMTINRSN